MGTAQQVDVSFSSFNFNLNFNVKRSIPAA